MRHFPRIGFTVVDGPHFGLVQKTENKGGSDIFSTLPLESSNTPELYSLTHSNWEWKRIMGRFC